MCTPLKSKHGQEFGFEDTTSHMTTMFTFMASAFSVAQDYAIALSGDRQAHLKCKLLRIIGTLQLEHHPQAELNDFYVPWLQLQTAGKSFMISYMPHLLVWMLLLTTAPL